MRRRFVEGSGALEPGILSKVPPQRRRVAAAGDFGGHEQRHHAAGARQLDVPFCERVGEIGQVSKAPHARRFPAGVTRLQCLANARWQALPADPRWIAGHEIESAGADDVAEMRLEAEERSSLVLTELAACPPQLTEIAAQLPQVDTMIHREATGAAEQVPLASDTQQLCDPSFERCDAVVEEALRQFRFR